MDDVGLHPGLKFEYFKQREYTRDWVQDTEAMLRDIYVQYKASSSEFSIAGATETSNDVSQVRRSHLRLMDWHSLYLLHRTRLMMGLICLPRSLLVVLQIPSLRSWMTS